MSGHNKWSKIRHKKGKEDARRSKVWTKIIREITVAARLGGEDASQNPRLRKAIDDARAANMPKDTLERAIHRGAGSEDAADYQELVYEAYGPAGVALYIEAMTDNRNRTSSDVGSALRHGQGTLGKSGSVGFLFDKRGQLVFDKAPEEGRAPTEDDLLEAALEHGVEELSDDGESFTLTCEPEAFQHLREALQAAGFVPSSAEVAMLPQTTVKVAGDDARALFKLIDRLEDLDDVQNVWSNFDIDPAELERLVGEG